MALTISDKDGKPLFCWMTIAPRPSDDKKSADIFGGLTIRKTTADDTGVLTLVEPPIRTLIPDITIEAQTNPNVAAFALAVATALQVYVTAEGI